jgi:5'-phosphate synthase pdxT subunit
MDVMVERNSFGRQKDSFEADLAIAGVSDHFNAVFIRAPHIVNVGEDVEVLAKHEGKIVAARDRHYLGCSFHPELTKDSGLTQYFIDIVKKQKVLNK